MAIAILKSDLLFKAYIVVPFDFIKNCYENGHSMNFKYDNEDELYLHKN
ncbi:hypothetical protein P20652_2731 [Pseudoalteromonas sp. BSi20652]|nr:hypothetical protein P20652_2731 [Pseudoalteromonas sp. BSi20652]